MRFLIFSLMLAVCPLPTAMAAGGEYQAAPIGQSAKPSASKKKQKEKRYINIDALHQSLPGSYLADETSLLFRVDNCDVIVLADDEHKVRFIYVKAAPHVKKSKRRDALMGVKSRLRLAYILPNQPHESISPDGTAALLYYDRPEEAESSDLIAVPRCEVLQNILCNYSVAERETAMVEGLACAFVVEKDGVELELAVDLSQPTVNYVEVRGGKVQNKMKTNPEMVVKGLFPALDSAPERAFAMFGKGAGRLRTLACDGTFYLGRNARFFVVGTADDLKDAVKNGVNIKKYGFATPDFSEWRVVLPSEVDASLLVGPLVDEPEEDTPAETPPDTPEPSAPSTTPEPPVETPTQTEPPPAATPADVPLTPEAAREAYLKMLRGM